MVIVYFVCLAGLGPVKAQIYYLLNDNNATTRTDQFRKVNADGTGDALIATNFADSPRYIAIDKANNRAFITEARANVSPRIYTVNLTTGATSTFLTSTSTVTGLTLDATNNYLYYVLSDAQFATNIDQLRRINLNGTNDVLLASGFENSPGPLALDLANNRLFAVDLRATAPKILSVNLTNNAVTTLVSSTSVVNGIAVDATNSKLYYVFTDSQVSSTADQLRRIGFTGTGDQLVASGFVNAPGDIAIDDANDRVLVSNIQANTPRIYAVDRTSGTASLLFTPPGTGSYTLSGLAFSPTTPLPVTLRYFGGRMVESSAVLNWATSQEMNAAGFTIQRSRDAIGFEAIGQVPSQAPDGTTATAQAYTFTDTQPLPGINYYRLEQKDRDGTRAYSKIIALSRENTMPVLYPNPTSTTGLLTLEPAVPYTRYELLDMSGKVIQSVDEPGELSQLSVSTLSTGSYVLRLQTLTGQQVFRFVK